MELLCNMTTVVDHHRGRGDIDACCTVTWQREDLVVDDRVEHGWSCAMNECRLLIVTGGLTSRDTMFAVQGVVSRVQPADCRLAVVADERLSAAIQSSLHDRDKSAPIHMISSPSDDATVVRYFITRWLSQYIHDAATAACCGSSLNRFQGTVTLVMLHTDRYPRVMQALAREMERDGREWMHSMRRLCSSDAFGMAALCGSDALPLEVMQSWAPGGTKLSDLRKACDTMPSHMISHAKLLHLFGGSAGYLLACPVLGLQQKSRSPPHHIEDVALDLMIRSCRLCSLLTHFILAEPIPNDASMSCARAALDKCLEQAINSLTMES